MAGLPADGLSRANSFSVCKPYSSSACLAQGSNLEEQSDSYEQYSSEAAADSLEQEFDPRLDDDEEDSSKETLGEQTLA